MPSPLGTLPVADPQYELEAMWYAAVKEYEKTTKVPLPSNTAEGISRDDVLLLIEGEQQRFTEFRSQWRMGPVVKIVLGLVESFAEVAGAGVSVVRSGILFIINSLTC